MGSGWRTVPFRNLVYDSHTLSIFVVRSTNWTMNFVILMVVVISFFQYPVVFGVYFCFGEYCVASTPGWIGIEASRRLMSY